jgi:nicotinate phosphoribosyltransferase
MIVASSDLNEYKIKDLLDNSAPIDAFGVGTELTTSRDDPSLSAVYKLMEYNGKSKIKVSEDKATFPGKKKLYRLSDEKGMFKEDILMLSEEVPPELSKDLLIPIMKNGDLLIDLPTLDEIQSFYFENIEKLPKQYKTIEGNQIFNLKVSKKLANLTESLKDKNY